MDEVKKLFKNPDAQYRTAPLWVWNADMTDEEIEKSLMELKSHGFGGAFVHPRPGMKITYLDDAYFQSWKKALETAKRLGMKLNIYDENSYPSGFGGGHVSCELPDCLSESVRYQVFSEEEMDFSEDMSGQMGDCETICVYACEKRAEKMFFCEDVTELPKAAWKGKGSHFAVVTRLKAQTAAWLAGFSDVDRLRPEVTEKFLEKVYDAYAEHFQEEFGSTVQAIFTDEPSLQGSSVYGQDGEGTLPLNHWFAYEFQKRKGYDLFKFIPCLFENWEEFENEKIRHDYYEVTQELWTENFLKPIQKWCQKHHLMYTGHFMEDGWPKPYYSVVAPGVMASYEYQDWPGIDLLLTGRLKDTASEIQEISMLEVMSAAHQFGKERVLCEAFGAGGYDSELKDYKRIGDYLFVNGVNFINEHLTYTSCVGARKRDHPQSFDWRQSWWKDYTHLNDYFGRISAVLSQGVSRERVLVLNPTITGYLYPRTADCSQLVQNILAEEPDMKPFLGMIQELRRLQWDINLGDEVIMKRHGKVENGKLEIVTQKYDVVILHECIHNMLPSTIELLKAFMEQGGEVLSLGYPGNYLSGVWDEAAYRELMNRENYRIFSEEIELLEYLNGHYERYFMTEHEFPEGIESIRRILEDGREFYFLINHSKQDVCTMADFSGSYMEEWNPWTGESRIICKGDETNKISFQLALKDGESRLFCVCHDNCDEAIVEKEEDYREIGFEILKTTTEEQNVWPLEYCDLLIDGETCKEYSTIAAGEKVYKKRGFSANPWDNAVQYRNRTYARNQFYNEKSGFSVIYRFHVEEGFQTESLKLAVEYGERYLITVNGILVTEDEPGYFLDHLIRQYEIHKLLRAGENEICLTAPRFDVELEIEPVILRGDFGVYDRNSRWVMDYAQSLNPGSIKGQGYPFYYGAILYDGIFSLRKEREEKVMIKFSEIEATSVSVRINQNYAGLVNINGRKGIDVTPYLKNGENQVQVRVCASMKNLLGPHFDPEKPRRTAWPAMWKIAPKIGNPKAKAYDLIDYGMGK